MKYAVYTKWVWPNGVPSAEIEKRLRRSGMVSATQYVSERSGEYKHVGQLLCESKEAHGACMAIMNSHDWDAEIPKQTSFETLKQYAEPERTTKKARGKETTS